MTGKANSGLPLLLASLSLKGKPLSPPQCKEPPAATLWGRRSTELTMTGQCLHAKNHKSKTDEEQRALGRQILEGRLSFQLQSVIAEAMIVLLRIGVAGSRLLTERQELPCTYLAHHQLVCVKTVRNCKKIALLS